MTVMVIDAMAFAAMRPEGRLFGPETSEILVLPDFIEWSVLLGNDPAMRAWLNVRRNGTEAFETRFTQALERRAAAWLRDRELGKPKRRIEWELVTVWAAASLAIEVDAGRIASDRYDVLVEQPDAARLLRHVGVRTVSAAQAAAA